MVTTAGISVKFKSVSLGGLVAVLMLQWMAPAQEDLGRQAQTIFAESCYGCHGAGQQMGNLRLDMNPGKVVTPGDSANFSIVNQTFAIPEPASIVMMGMGLASVGIGWRRRGRKVATK